MNLQHPSTQWRANAEPNSRLTTLRLTAMAAHMRRDAIAARRAALIDLLADGHTHSRAAILTHVATVLDDPTCWGQVPREALARDLRTLRDGGLQIAYTRRAGIEGYYLQDPPIERPPTIEMDAISWPLVDAIRTQTAAQKAAHANDAAEFALIQTRALLAQQHPEWHQTRIEEAARQRVFGITLPLRETT